MKNIFQKTFTAITLATTLAMMPAVYAQDVESTTTLTQATEATAAPAKAAGRVMIVFDASGSMLAKIGDEPKIDIARKAVVQLLETWDPSIEVGLIAYGNTRKGDCGDIAVIVPCGPVDKQVIIDAVNNLTPLGKTPLSDATILAAETLKFSEEPATVILISDGEETCDKDPCAVGKELEARGINFTAHVIGFDVSDAKGIGQLRCLAENTGGKFFAASDAGELQQALADVAKEVTAPAAVAVADERPLQLSATYSEDGEAVPDGLSWSVYETTTGTMATNTKAVFSSYDTVAKPDLPPASYLVRVKKGNTKREVTWDATTTPQLAVNLDAGMLTAAARPAEGADPITNGLSWSVNSAESSAGRLAHSYDAKPLFILPAGKYTVDVTYGKAAASEDVTIEAGKPQETELVMDAGILAPTALYAPESEQITEGLSWTVLSDKKNIKGERKKMGHSYDAKPQFTLPAGKYILFVTAGKARAEEPVEVTANEQVTPEFHLNAGVLLVKMTDKTGPHKTYTVYSGKEDLVGKRKRIDSTHDKSMLRVLPEGTYKVDHDTGDGIDTKDAEVKAGERTEIVF